MNWIKKSTVFTLGTILLFASCSKRNQDDDVEVDIDVNFSTNEVAAEQTFTVIDNIADQAEVAESITRSGLSTNVVLSCATISKDTTQGPSADTIKIIVDFGNVNCISNDGPTINGKVIVIRLMDQSSGNMVERKVETEDFYWDGYLIEVTKRLAFGGFDTDQNPYWTVDGSSKLWLSSTSYVSREITRKRTWIDGTSTPLNWTDDTWKIEGTCSGVQYDGQTYTSEITDALELPVSCGKVTKGIIEISVGSKVFTIEYGDGTCDGQALGRYEDHTWTIQL